LQMTASPMTNTYAASVNGFNAMNNNFSPQYRGAYTQYTPPVIHSHTMSNGSNNFMQLNPDSNQQSVQQPAPSYVRIQANGGFF